MTAESHPETIAADRATLGDYWSAIYRRRWVVLLVTASAGFISYYISARMEPQYESKTEFYVPADVAGAAMGPEQGKPRMPSGEQDHAKAYSQILKGLESLKEISERYPEKSVLELKQDVDIAITRLGLIQVYVRDTDPQVAAQVANGFVEYFDDFNQRIIQDQMRRTLENLEQEIVLVEKERAELEEARSAFQKEQGVSALATLVQELENQRLRLEEAREMSTVDLRGVERQLATLEEQLTKESTAYRGDQVVLTSGLISDLREQIVGLEVERAGKAHELRDDHPEMVSLTRRLDEARAGLQLEMQRVIESRAQIPGSLHEHVRERLANLHAERSSVEARIEALGLVIAQQKQRIDSVPELSLALERFNQDITDQEVRLAGLRGQRNAILSRALELRTSAIVLEKAVPSPLNDPIFPIMPLNVSIAIIAGLVTGVLYALLLDYMATRRHARKLQRVQFEQWARALTEGWGPAREGGTA